MRPVFRNGAPVPAPALTALAKALGGDISGSSVLCPGPGHSQKDRSLSVTPSFASPTGFICHSHAGDRWQDCRDHVAALLGMGGTQHRQASPAPSASPSTSPSTSDRSATAIKLWKSGIEPRGTVAERYLQSRGLKLPDDIANSVVRFIPSCRWRDEQGGLVQRAVMLIAFRGIADDRLQAVHRTALTSDGQKIGRKMLGPVGGAAMKIDADTDVEQGLTICEGFETGLAGRALGFRPVWALGSAGAIGAFPVLSGIETLTILAEPDAANARAIERCGNRWSDAGREVLLVRSVAGDMNDAILKAGAA
jgi:putative DNA primase/helicase